VNELGEDALAQKMIAQLGQRPGGESGEIQLEEDVAAMRRI
jgi:hypothetical protein